MVVKNGLWKLKIMRQLGRLQGEDWKKASVSRRSSQLPYDGDENFLAGLLSAHSIKKNRR